MASIFSLFQLLSVEIFTNLDKRLHFRPVLRNAPSSEHVQKEFVMVNNQHVNRPSSKHVLPCLLGWGMLLCWLFTTAGSTTKACAVRILSIRKQTPFSTPMLFVNNPSGETCCFQNGDWPGVSGLSKNRYAGTLRGLHWACSGSQKEKKKKTRVIRWTSKHFS